MFDAKERSERWTQAARNVSIRPGLILQNVLDLNEPQTRIVDGFAFSVGNNVPRDAFIRRVMCGGY